VRAGVAGAPRASPGCHPRITTASASARKISSVAAPDRLASKASVPLDKPANARPTTGITGRSAVHHAARPGREPDQARQHPRDAAPAGRRHARAAGADRRAAAREKREVGAEEPGQEQDARQVGDIHRESPLGTALGTVRREPEEGEGRELLELPVERDRRPQHVSGRALTAERRGSGTRGSYLFHNDRNPGPLRLRIELRLKGDARLEAVRP
jgi:hypothetical protein